LLMMNGLKNLWNNLLNVFKREIKDFDGVVARYFIEKRLKYKYAREGIFSFS
jgi:hypothetical protein